MEKTTNYQLGNLISKNLDLDLFFAIIIYKDEVRLSSYYSKSIEKYLLKKLFEKKDYLYQNDKSKLEFENSSIRVVLHKNKI
jgi:hypothetical protein